MNIRRSIQAVALLGMVGICAAQHRDARDAVAEPAESPQFRKIVHGTVDEEVERLTIVNVSSFGIIRNHVSPIEIDAPPTFLSIGPDGWPTLAGMESVTVTAESIVIVFDFSTEPELAEVYADLAQDTVSVVAENPTTLRRVTSITTYGTDLTSLGIIAQQDLFSMEDDGRVALNGIRNVTVSEDRVVLVFDRALEAETNLADSSVARIPTTCHAEVVSVRQPDGTYIVTIDCKGTCPGTKECTGRQKALNSRAEVDKQKTTFWCECM